MLFYINLADEITNIHDLDFEYVEVEIEGPEGNPLIIGEKCFSSSHITAVNAEF
jgi:hypothetical protein